MKNYIALMFYSFGINFMILSVAGVKQPLCTLLSFLMIPFPLIHCVLSEKQWIFYLLNIPYVLVALMCFFL